MVSRLPITTRPAHQEIAVSYLARLAALHEMPVEDLWQQVSLRKTTGGNTRRLDGDLLATVANQPRHRLDRAIVELRTPEPDWLALRHEPQLGCRRCDARHPGGPVLHLFAHHDYVCTRHQVWIGPPDQVDHPQPGLAALPEIVAAQHRHRRLLRRIGPAATFDAVLTGFLICGMRWNFTNTDTVTDGDAWHDWVRRADLLIPPGTTPDTFSASRLFAATYPEAVSVAELVGSLRWRRLAAGGPEDQRTFAAEIGRRLGLHDYHPLAFRDPIAHWMEQDCWRPPSLPNSDYRRLKTFGGATFPRPTRDSDTKRRTSAHWFSVHGRGGDAIVHHRALNPVILRDWSRKMEMFTAALELTASTNTPVPKHPNVKDAKALATTEWVRPEPAPMSYLDTVVEPVSWAQRPGPRPHTGARPRLPNEHRAYNRAMTNLLRPQAATNTDN